MSTLSTSSAFRRVLSAFVLILAARWTLAVEPPDVEILHDPLRCWPTDQFLFADATFQPPTDLLTAKLYHRSAAYSDYYFVELTLGRDGRGRAILPMAEADAPGVVYYLELVTKSFSAFRTGEFSVPVASGSECRELDPKSAFYTGPNPDIAVGATRAGVPALPPDFQASGIARFISVLGPTPPAGPAAGGGVSGKTVGILAGGGGAGAAALLFLGGDSQTTTTGLGGITTVTTTAGSTTTATGGGPSSTTTTTTGGGGPTSTTTTAGGPTTTTSGPSSTTTSGPSTTTSGPSSTTTSGPSTTTSAPSTTTSGPSTTTTSAPTTTSSAPTTTTSAPSTTTTAATTSVSGANVTVSKGASGPAVRGGTFNYNVTVTNNGPGTATSVLLRDDLPPQVTIFAVFPGCSGSCSGGASPVLCGFGTMASGTSCGATINVFVPASVAVGTVLTNRAEVSWIDSIARTASTSHNITVSALRTEPASPVELSYRTLLDVKPKKPALAGSIVLNGQSAETIESGSPRLLRSTARRGTNRIEAYAEPSSREGAWVFDFAGAEGFEAGSIQVESGQVASVEGYSVTFALREASGALRFTFRLRNDP